jgi:sulfur-oxidizing protein SoxY
MTTPVDRRWLLRSAGAACLAVVGSPSLLAAQPPLDSTGLADVMAELGGPAVPSSAVALDVPAIAEDGAVVPVAISSTLAGTRELLILVDVNPQKLALRFSVPEGTEPFLATRIRMAGSGTVLAAARTADGTLHLSSRSVQVTVGGCG